MVLLAPVAVAGLVRRRGGPAEVFAGVTFAAGLYLLRRHVIVAVQLVVPAVRHWTAPYVRGIADWVKAFLPLTMTPLALLLFAAEVFSKPARFLTGVLVIAVAVLVVTLGRREVHEAVDGVRWLWGAVNAFRDRAIRLAAALVIAVTAALVWATPSLEKLHDSGVDSGFVFGVAVVLWLAAVGCRLLGNARSVVRALAVALLAVSMTGVLHDLGLLGGPFPTLGWRVWSVVAVGALIGSSLIEGWMRILHQARASVLSAHLSVAEVALLLDLVSVIGLAVAGMSAVGAATAAGLAATDMQQGAKVVDEDVKRHFSRHRPETMVDDALLARQYAPVLAYARDEGWSPELVDSYVRRAKLVVLTPPNEVVHDAGNSATPDLEVRTRASGRSVTTATLPQHCAERRRTTCYVLTCSGHEGQCAPPKPHSGGDSVSGGVYARVIRQETNPDLFEVANPFLGRLSALIEYWIFYPYDLWTTHVVVGRVDQQHEADWEALVVGLGDKEPLFVAYSAHCSGHWYKWSDIPVTAADTAPPGWNAGRPFADDVDASTHPLVAVATGSHANYPRVAERRAPDWGSCRDVPEQTVATLSYTSNVRDVTGDYRHVYPKRVELITGSSPPAAYAGTWGWHDHTTLTSARLIRFPTGDGPTSPKLKALWREPLRTIFCGRWHPQRCTSARSD